MCKQGVSAIAFTVNNMKDNCTRCKNVENKFYLVVLVLPEMVLELQL